MARYRKRRFYRRKGKWSTRLTNISVSQLVGPGVALFIYRTLATNPAQDDNTVSQRFTVKNVNAQVELSATGDALTYLNQLQHYILFVPQGYQLTENTPYEHPEWIMAHRFIGTPVNTLNPGYAPLRISTRLARKLDTGDRVIYLLIGRNTAGEGGPTVNAECDGIVKLNTKAN
jgi:hypothetical protein